MDKINMLTIILIMILGALAAILITHPQVLKLTTLSISSQKASSNYHSWTKAICDENNFCQDNVIECEYDQIKSITPITGAFIKHNQNWQDPRTSEQINKICK